MAGKCEKEGGEARREGSKEEGDSEGGGSRIRGWFVYLGRSRESHGGCGNAAMDRITVRCRTFKEVHGVTSARILPLKYLQ